MENRENPSNQKEKVVLTPKELEVMKARVERAEKLAHHLDKGLHLDALTGLLLPEGGDAAGALAGMYIVFEAKRLNMPAKELAKMTGRVGLDAIIGAIPVVGDIFDFVYKSNIKNAEVLRKHFEEIASDNDIIKIQEKELTAEDRDAEMEVLVRPKGAEGGKIYDLKQRVEKKKAA
jgi:hypothetical protein